jgi:hypothetical protein
MVSKRKILTLDQWIKVIELCKTKSGRKVAEELGVGKNPDVPNNSLRFIVYVLIFKPRGHDVHHGNSIWEQQII